MNATIYISDFKNIVKNTKKFISKNGNNKLMEFIYLEFDKPSKEVRAIALDGHRISIEYSFISDIDESFSCYIKPTIPTFKESAFATIEKVGNKAYIGGDYVIGYVQPEGSYFDVDTMIKNIEEEQIVSYIGVNSDFLKDALDSIGKSDGRGIAKIEVRNPKQALIIRSGKKNIKLVLPVNIHC